MTTEPQRGGVGELPPIARDESYDRTYIPLPGGWEIQTRGKGSSFRICDTKTGERWNIERQPYIDEMLELMGREIHAACASPVKVESGEAVSEMMVSAAYDAFAASAPDAYEYGPDDIRKALETALSTRRPDTGVPSKAGSSGESQCTPAIDSGRAAEVKPST